MINKFIFFQKLFNIQKAFMDEEKRYLKKKQKIRPRKKVKAMKTRFMLVVNHQ